jgi:PKD repeat protein
VTFSSAGSTAGDSSALTYAWDFTNDGTTDSTAANPSHTYTGTGSFTARLTVRNTGNGLTSTATTAVVVGNTRPTVTINVPDGGFSDFGDRIPYTVTVTDPEDSSIDCTRVSVQTQLGHDSHAHPLDVYPGCSGVLLTEADAGDGHGPGQNLYTVVTAQYTDGGGAGGTPALVGSTKAQLQAKNKEAEHFTGQSGISVFDRPAARAGKRLGDIDHNEWISFAPVNLKNIGSITVGASSGGLGGDVEFRAGSPTGTLLGKATISPTGSYDNVVSPTVALANKPTGTFELYVKFVNANQGTSTQDLVALDWLRFNGAGVKQEPGGTLTASATPATGTKPLAVSFAATATAGSGVTISDYSWDFGDNAAVVHGPTLTSTSHTYTVAGSYTARVTVTYSTGETRASTLAVTVS